MQKYLILLLLAISFSSAVHAEQLPNKSVFGTLPEVPIPARHDFTALPGPLHLLLRSQVMQQPITNIPASASGTIAFVNKAQCAALGGCTTTGVSMTGANLCVIALTYDQSTAGAVSSSPANTWVPGTATYASASTKTQIFWAYAPTVSGSMTFTTTNLATVLNASCWSGTVGSTVDQQNGGIGSVVTSFAPGSVTPTSPNELVISIVSVNLNVTPPTGFSASGYTLLFSTAYTNGTNYGSGAGYLIQTTAAATNPLWMWTNTSSDVSGANATFK
jgi:hypothetical protein